MESDRNCLIASVEFYGIEQTHAELSEIVFTEAEMSCAGFMALVYNNGEVGNRTIINTLGVDMRTTHRTRKKFEESKDTNKSIIGTPKSFNDLRKSVRNREML